MKNKTITIRGKDKRHIEQARIIEPLLHTFSHLMMVGFGLNDSEWHVGLMVKHDIRRLHFLASSSLTTHNHLTIAQFHLLADLGHIIPANLFYCG